MLNHDERQRDARAVPVDVQVGAHRHDQRDGAHGRAEEGEPFAPQHDAADHQGEHERHADVGAVLNRRVEDDVPVGSHASATSESPSAAWPKVKR